MTGRVAARFHLLLGSVRDWEQGAHRPDKAAQVLLTVIANDPDAVGARSQVLASIGLRLGMASWFGFNSAAQCALAQPWALPHSATANE